jgi:hypothetical protein
MSEVPADAYCTETATGSGDAATLICWLAGEGMNNDPDWTLVAERV